MHRNEPGWISCFLERKALWIHSGNSTQPHVELTSGQHSNGYFNSAIVMADEFLGRAAARDLWRKFVRYGVDSKTIRGVVGPQTGATLLAELLREQMDPTGRNAFSASPAKQTTHAGKVMVFSEDEKRQLPGQNVLLCEDVITTGGSVDLAAQAVIEAKGNVLPFVLTLVNRSGLRECNGRKIVSLIEKELPIWTPAQCTLCGEGSKVLRPKGRNWDRLMSQSRS